MTKCQKIHSEIGQPSFYFTTRASLKTEQFSSQLNIFSDSVQFFIFKKINLLTWVQILISKKKIKNNNEKKKPEWRETF